MVHKESFSQPFQSLDRTFELLTTGPGRPVLYTGDLKAAPASELTAERVVHTLRHEPDGVSDAVWRRVISRIRQSNAVWTVIAAKAMVPRMISARLRLGTLDPDQLADIDTELVACLVEQLHTMDAGAEQIGARLWRALVNTACRYQYRVQRERCRRADIGPERCVSPGPEAGRGPVSVLAETTAQGVLTAQEAELIARTRLERTSLARVAERMGLSYITARRRRRRAEGRLALALGRAESQAG